MSRIDEIDATTATADSSEIKSQEGRALLRVVKSLFAGLILKLNSVIRQVDNELDIGYPGFGALPLVKGNLAGQWVSASVTAGGTAVTFTHNLGLPVEVVAGRAYNQCNVTWLARFIFGDRTGANAAPAAGAATAHSSLYFRLGDAVTANSIELRVQTDLAVGATAPLYVDVRFFPAIV